MKTIMLCLNQAGIGGVETAVLNQTIQLIRKNYRVVIIAKDGIYRQEFEKQGAIYEQFEFVVQNKYDLEKINYIIELLERYKVEQVHIHQFDCINTVFPACIIKDIPYVAYVHTGITGVYDWFENCFPGYKTMFELYFKGAEKIIPITEEAQKENQAKYKISDDKYFIIKNSINFEENICDQSQIPTEIKNFLIISRLSHEKVLSVKNSILIFKEYYNRNKNARLTILGDGDYREEIEKETKDIKEVVEYLGQRNNVMEIISKNDIILALDRCILEAISMKKIALISGYDNIKSIVTPDIIEKASDTNFSGKNFENKTVSDVLQQIESLDQEKIKNIVEENYKFAYEKLNVANNFFVIKNVEGKKPYLNSKDVLKTIVELQNLYANNIEYTDHVYNECKKTQKWLEDKVKYLETEIKFRQEEISNLNNELSKIYQNKTWKIIENINKLLKK